jgi:hypothetical protein
MKSRLRQVLADSHVAAIAVAVLLFAALNGICRGLWDPLYRFGGFVVTGIAIWDIPYIPSIPTAADRLMLLTVAHYLYSAFACILGALLLSRWVYGMGPLRSLNACRNELIRRRDV